MGWLHPIHGFMDSRPKREFFDDIGRSQLQQHVNDDKISLNKRVLARFGKRLDLFRMKGGGNKPTADGDWKSLPIFMRLGKRMDPNQMNDLNHDLVMESYLNYYYPYLNYPGSNLYSLP